MKIYPGNHKVQPTSEVNLDTDIPLAYINTDFLSYDIKLIPMIPTYDKKVVMPYTTFNSLDVCLFDANGNTIDNTNVLQRNGSSYYYMPSNAQSFDPQIFSYNIICKKNLRYKSNAVYNMKVSCADDTDTLYLSNNLIKLFGDAPDRGISPKNVYVNNKDINIESLTTGSLDDADFIFIQSSDGVTYKIDWKANTVFAENQLVEKDNTVYLCISSHTSTDDFNKDTAMWKGVSEWAINAKYLVGDIVFYKGSIYESTTAHTSSGISFDADMLSNPWSKVAIENDVIDIEYYQSSFVNLWISCYFDSGLSSNSFTFSIDSPILYKTASMYLDKAYNLTNIPSLDSSVSVRNIFSSTGTITYVPVSIMEYPKKGFVMKSHRNFLTQVFKGAQSDINFFYEVLMYVYSNSYVKSKSISEWITDTIPDYIVVNNGISQKTKFTSDMQLDKIFQMDLSDITFSDIIINSPNITFMGIEDNYVIFQKRIDGQYNIYADPPKPAGSLSVFTTRQNVVYYKDFLYGIADNISNKVSWTKTDSSIDVTVSNFNNTENGINITDSQTISINLIDYINNQVTQLTNGNYYICCRNNIVNIVDKTKYTSGIVLAELQVSLTQSSSNIFDMRQKGGGLPEGEEPNFDLLDIGHIYGRPYRSASTIIITLPTKLKQYEDLIRAAIDKHISGEDFPVFIFED